MQRSETRGIDFESTQRTGRDVPRCGQTRALPGLKARQRSRA